MNQRGQINSVIVKINMDGTENEPRFVVEEVTAQHGRCFEGAEKLLRARFECLCCKTGYVVLPLIMQMAPIRTEMEVSIAEDEQNPIQQVVEYNSDGETGSTLNEVIDSDEEQTQGDSEVEADMIFPMDTDPGSTETPLVKHQARVDQSSDSEESNALTPSEDRSKAVIRLIRIDNEAREESVTVAPVGHQERNAEHFYQCDICKVSIKFRNSLIRHMKIHMGIRYSCSECPKSFNDKSNLSKHKKCFHQNEFRNCEVCGWSKTCTKVEYYSHLRRRHPEFRKFEYQPEVKSFNGVDFPCVYCEPQVTFKDFKKLKEHLRVTHDRKFTCSRCPKAFGVKSVLKHHIDSVHEKKTFNCPKCDKFYSRKTSLSRHLHSHNVENSSEKMSKENTKK